MPTAMKRIRRGSAWLPSAAAVLASVSWSVAAFGAEGQDGDLPTWALASVDGLDAAGWTAPARLEGRAFRSARAGRTAVLAVRPWWGNSFRPPEGTVYILRVTYRDTATSPVRFLSHAGVAAYWGLTEVHRFGGSGDGAWKTADLPLSWDLLCRRKAAGEAAAEIAFASPADLPIETIRVLPAEAGSAGRYFDETRRWIAAAQADKRRSASRGPVQTAAIPEAMKGQAIVPYPCDWMSPLWQNSAPQPGQAGAAVKVRMARNEYEPATFAVYAAGRALTGVTCTVGPLAGDGGRLACELDLRTAEYSAVQETVDYGTSVDSGKYRMFPQRLWPAYPVDIARGRSHLFWITVRTLGEASRPGRYTGRITIRDASGHTADLPLEVEVLPVTLRTVNEAGLRLGSCTRGLPTLQEVKTLAEANHNGMDLWFACTNPQISFDDGKLSLDWSYLDDWMAYARQCGMTEMVWFFGGDPKRFPNSLELERDLYRLRGRTAQERQELYREFCRKTSADPDKVIAEVRPLYVEFVRQTAEHAKAKNWPRLVLHPFDEPGKWTARPPEGSAGTGAGPWIRGHFGDCCGLIRQGWPDATVGLEAHVVPPCLAFLKDVNVFCTNRAWQDAELARRLAEAKVEFWQYANCDDQAPAYRTRYSFGFYFASFGSRGALVWAYNWLARFDTSGRDNWGYAWGTPFGTVFCPSLVGLREGLDDRRWIETLKARAGKDPAVEALLAEVLKEARAQRAETPYTSYNEPQDPRKLDQWRGRIMDALAAASSRTP